MNRGAFMNRWSRSRRDLLRTLGIGAACLPILHATRSLQAAVEFPRRLMIVLQTNGLPINIWDSVPHSPDLSKTTLPAVFGSLKPHKPNLLILPQLDNPAYQGAGHGAYGTIFSGGPNNPAEEYWTPAVATLDQVCADAAERNGANVSARTLALQVQADRSESRLGAIRCFFAGNDLPVTPEASPYNAAARLFFGKEGDDPAVTRLLAERKSMLDYVGKDLERFGKNLGTEDRLSVEAHLAAIREIEKQLSGGSTLVDCGNGPALGQPLDLAQNTNYPALLALHLDIAAAALRCDVTRVVTLQLGNAYGGNVVFNWLGIDGPGLEYLGGPRTWHDMAHREVDDGDKGCNICAGRNDKQTIDTWFMTQFAGLIDRFAQVTEGDGTMLDNSALLWANHMENGANHNAHRIPWMIAGKAGGYLRTNQLLKPEQQIQKTNVMCELANMMGANLPYFGAADYGAPLADLRAV